MSFTIHHPLVNHFLDCKLSFAMINAFNPSLASMDLRYAHLLLAHSWPLCLQNIASRAFPATMINNSRGKTKVESSKGFEEPEETYCLQAVHGGKTNEIAPAMSSSKKSRSRWAVTRKEVSEVARSTRIVPRLEPLFATGCCTNLMRDQISDFFAATMDESIHSYMSDLDLADDNGSFRVASLRLW